MGNGGPQQPVSIDARRSGPRREARVEVCLFDEFGEPVVLETRDLGPAGVFVRSDLIFETGEELFVSLSLEEGPSFVVRGRVVRAQLGEGGRPAGMGIAFLDLTAREDRWLRWYAEQRDERPRAVPVLAEVPVVASAARHMLP